MLSTRNNGANYTGRFEKHTKKQKFDSIRLFEGRETCKNVSLSQFMNFVTSKFRHKSIAQLLWSIFRPYLGDILYWVVFLHFPRVMGTDCTCWPHINIDLKSLVLKKMVFVNCLFSGRTIVRFPKLWYHNHQARLCVHHPQEKIRNCIS